VATARRSTRVLDFLARKLARLRALDPYPGWTFGVPRPLGPAAILRLLYWRRWRRRGIEHPLSIPFYGGMTVELNIGNDVSRCLYVSGCFEPNELSFLARTLRPGMVFVDAGANEGLFTVLAARAVDPGGLVVAVEPSPRERARLRRNVARNGLAVVRVREEALADAPGKAVLRVADLEHAGQNTLGSFVYDGVHEATSVPVDCITLDQLIEEEAIDRVDVLKIDVEGAEMKVLVGADRLLSRLRPVLLLELQEDSLRQQGASAADVSAHLAALDYEICPFSQETGVPVAARNGPAGLNVVAIPKERLDETLAVQGAGARL